MLVAEYHEGAGAGTPDGATLEEEVAAGGAFARDRHRDRPPTVDAIFTGHTHKQYAWSAPVPGEPSATRPVLQTGSYGEFIGKVVADVRPGDRRGHRVHRDERRRAPATAATPTLVADVPAGRRGQARSSTRRSRTPPRSATQPVGVGHRRHHHRLRGRHVRRRRLHRRRAATTVTTARESTLGNLVANALRDALARPEPRRRPDRRGQPGWPAGRPVLPAPATGRGHLRRGQRGPAVRQQPLDHDAHGRAVQDDARAAVADATRTARSRPGRTCSSGCRTT